jgi:1-phosphofructokinase family hexose kinase
LTQMSHQDKFLVASPRIVCLSVNPAIDTRLRFRSFTAGKINRAYAVEPFAGGKAAHVAFAAHALRAKVAWLGFLGGATGEEFETQFRGLGMELVIIRSRKPTRRNLELLEDSGRITEVLEPGAQPSADECAQMLRTLEANLLRRQHEAVVVISGSLPAGVRPSFYRTLIVAARSVGSRVFVDTSGEPLRGTLSCRPDFVKPNRAEAEAVLGRRLKNAAGALQAANELIERGAQSAAISLGAEGLVWVEGKNGPAWFARPPHLKAISTVGCGDATLAGFAFAARDIRGEAAIRLAAACGAANCLAESPGRISRADVHSLMPRIEIRRFS